VEVLYASRRGRNAADDRIVRYIEAHAERALLEVVTSDRDLGSRARALVAGVRGVRWLLDQLDALEG
jgi:hypothetical protein